MLRHGASRTISRASSEDPRDTARIACIPSSAMRASSNTVISRFAPPAIRVASSARCVGVATFPGRDCSVRAKFSPRATAAPVRVPDSHAATSPPPTSVTDADLDGRDRPRRGPSAPRIATRPERRPRPRPAPARPARRAARPSRLTVRLPTPRRSASRTARPAIRLTVSGVRSLGLSQPEQDHASRAAGRTVQHHLVGRAAAHVADGERTAHGTVQRPVERRRGGSRRLRSLRSRRPRGARCRGSAASASR